MTFTVQSTSAGQPSAFEQEAAEFRSLRERIRMDKTMTGANELAERITALPGKLRGLRSGGYVYKNFLEGQVDGLTERWSENYTAMVDAIQASRAGLDAAVIEIENLHARRSQAADKVLWLGAEVERLEREMDRRLAPIVEETNRLNTQLDDTAWMLQQAAQASFAFENGEAPVEAVPANWKKPDDKDGMDGVLYLTERRLIFEQKEEVATKKVLFVTTAKQKVQALAWGVPTGQIGQMKSEKRGLFGKDDFLVLTFGPGAPLPGAELHLKGESGESWVGFLNYVRSGTAARERTGEGVSGGEATPASGPILMPMNMGDDLLMLAPEFNLAVGTELLLDEMHVAVVYPNEQPLDVLGPGRRVLRGDSLPLLCGQGDNALTEVSAPMVFVTIRDIASVKWGTPMPVTLRAADSPAGYISVVMFGNFTYKIADPAAAIRQMLNASRTRVSRDEMRSLLQPYIVQALTTALGRMTGDGQTTPGGLMQRQDELAAAAKEEAAGLLSPFGIELRYMDIENMRQVGQ